MTDKKRYVILIFILGGIFTAYWTVYRYPNGYIHGVRIVHNGRAFFAPQWRLRCNSTQTACQMPLDGKQLYFQLNPSWFEPDTASPISMRHIGCRAAWYGNKPVACDIGFFSTHPVEWGPYVNLKIDDADFTLTFWQKALFAGETFMARTSMGDEAVWKPVVVLLAILTGVGFIFFLNYLVESNGWVVSAFTAVAGLALGLISLPIWYILLLTFQLLKD